MHGRFYICLPGQNIARFIVLCKNLFAEKTFYTWVLAIGALL